MQITINQNEIETAIRNHVLGLISVRQNMRIDIDLKATRKEDGYTAIIDIYPDDGPGSGEPVEGKSDQTNTATAAEVKAESKPNPAPKAPPKAEPKAVEEPEVVAAKEAVAEAPADEPSEPAEPPVKVTKALFKKAAEKPAEPEVAPASDAVEAPRSIFSGLKKPVNTPAVEADAAA